MGSADEGHIGHQLSAEHHTGSWDHKPQAIVYDPSSDRFGTEKCGGECSNLATGRAANLVANCDSYPVHLPWWSNKVDIYADPKNRSGFVATIRLDRLGPAKVWQRRFRHNYTILHVKGLKPGKASSSSESSSASMPVVLKDHHTG